MINQQDKYIIIMYAATVVVVGVLVVVIMNFNTWFLNPEGPAQSGFTPAARDTVGGEDVKADLFSEAKFKALGPLITDEELKQTQETPVSETPGGTSGSPATSPTRREVRKSNPFIPF